MNFFIMVSLFLSAALGVFRGIDLALLTDAETGLCIVGPVWLRYGALAVAVGAAVAAGRCSQPQAGALRGRCVPSGVVALAAAVCYGEAALGLSWLRKDWKTPTRSLTPAVLGSAVFYWCVLARFMENSSSWHRVAPTAMVWQLLAGLMFLSALARALYLPGTSDGRTLCAGGLAAFALCLCWELPTVLQTLVQEGGGALLTPTLLFRLGLCCVGALGALSAVRCTRTEQDV